MWRLRRHEEGLDWPCTNKEQSKKEWGERAPAWSSAGGWVVRRGHARVQPRRLRAALGQTGWRLLPNWAGQYAGEGADRG